MAPSNVIDSMNRQTIYNTIVNVVSLGIGIEFRGFHSEAVAESHHNNKSVLAVLEIDL